jgi:hypothetical protein
LQVAREDPQIRIPEKKKLARILSWPRSAHMLKHSNLLLALLVSFLSGSCITTYRGFPEERVGAPPSPSQFKKLHYHIQPLNMIMVAGGPDALQNYIVHRSPFTTVEPVPVISKGVERNPIVPEKGLFLNVEVRWKPPSVPALIFLYLSAQTVTILPSWSHQEGYVLTFTMYLDGKPQPPREYTVNRHLYVWLPLIIAAPANLGTYTEREAFEATAHQYFSDIQPWLTLHDR